MSSRRENIDALEKGLKVLEALEGIAFEPISQKRIVQRCQLPRDFVRRSLITFQDLGWVEQNSRKEYRLGPRFLRMSNRYSDVCLAALSKD